MQLVARLFGIGLAIAVLMLFVLPAFLRTSEEPARVEAPSGPVPPVAVPVPSPEGSSSFASSWEKKLPAPKESKIDVPPGATPRIAGGSPRLADLPPEIRRFVSIEKGHAIAVTGAGEKRYFRVIVEDGGTLKAGKRRIALEGITARQKDAECTDANGRNWPCGMRARAALMRFIRGRAVTCQLPPAGERDSFTTRCEVGGTDLSQWMVRQGWAKSAEEAGTKLADAQAAAEKEMIGLWSKTVSLSAPVMSSGPEPQEEEEESQWEN